MINLKTCYTSILSVYKKTQSRAPVCSNLSLPSFIASASFINFSNSKIIQNDVEDVSANEATLTDNVVYYLEDRFRFQFIFSGPPDSFASSVVDYYGIGIDVFHAIGREIESSQILMAK